MKRVEVRRHAPTKKGAARASGSLLSSEGVRAARRLGDELSGTDHVMVGPDRRHIETAIAMGFAVDEAVDWPQGYLPGVVEHHEQWDWDAPFVEYAARIDRSADLRAMTVEHLGHWMRGIEEVADGGALLVVSSGGSIEPVLVAAHPNGDLTEWGRPFGHLEGATLIFDGAECVEIRIRRAGIAEASTG